MSNSDAQESLKTRSIPPVITEIHRVIDERNAYHAAVNQISAENSQLKKSGLELKPVPEVTPGCIEADYLSAEEARFKESAKQGMLSILGGAETEMRNQYNPPRDEKGILRAQNEAVVFSNDKKIMDRLITQVDDNVNGHQIETTSAARAAGVLEGVWDKRYIPQTEEITAKVVAAHPESVHLSSFPGRYLNEIRMSHIDTGFGNSSKETILQVLADPETSPLSPAERDIAEFRLNESRGFRFYQAIKDARQVSDISPTSVSEIIGVNIPVDRLRQANNITDIPVVIAKLSQDETVSAPDRAKLQQIAVGCIKSMGVFANELSIGDSPNPDRGQRIRAAAVSTAINLVDLRQQSFQEMVIKGRDLSPAQAELQRIYHDNMLNFKSGDRGNIIGTQHLEVIRKRDADRVIEEQREKDLAAEKALELKKSEIAKNQQIIIAFDDPQIQEVFAQANLAESVHPNEPIIESLNKLLDGANITQSQFDFAATVANKIYDIRQTRGIVGSTTELIIDNKGFLGFGEKSHTITKYNCDHSALNSRLKIVTDRQAPGEPISLDDEAEKLAIDLFKKIPARKQQ